MPKPTPKQAAEPQAEDNSAGREKPLEDKSDLVAMSYEVLLKIFGKEKADILWKTGRKIGSAKPESSS